MNVPLCIEECNVVCRSEAFPCRKCCTQALSTSESLPPQKNPCWTGLSASELLGAYGVERLTAFFENADHNQVATRSGKPIDLGPHRPRGPRLHRGHKPGTAWPKVRRVSIIKLWVKRLQWTRLVYTNGGATPRHGEQDQPVQGSGTAVGNMQCRPTSGHPRRR